MKTNKPLKVMICMPCNQMPASERHIVAKVTDGKVTRFIKYGRYQSINSILRSVPVVFRDRAHDNRRRRKSA